MIGWQLSDKNCSEIKKHQIRNSQKCATEEHLALRKKKLIVVKRKREKSETTVCLWSGLHNTRDVERGTFRTTEF